MGKRTNLLLLAANVVVAGFLIRMHGMLSTLEQQVATPPIVEVGSRSPPPDSMTPANRPSRRGTGFSPRNGNPPLDRWLARIAELKRWIAQSTDRQMPGLDAASPEEWLLATFDNPLVTEADFQRAHFALNKLVRTREGRARM